MKEKAESRIRVSIFGEYYTIKGEGDPSYIAKVASLVDEKMKEIADLTKLKDPKKIAILAALNLADDYLSKTDEQQGEMIDQVIVEKTKRLISLLDEGLIGKAM